MSTSSISSGGSSNISDYDLNDSITSIKTADEMLFEGLLLAGFDADMQKRQPKSNLRDFIDRYGSSPTELSIVWADLQTTNNPEGFVPENKRNLVYFFVANHFLKQCPTESEKKAAYQKLSLRRQTLRDWIWFFVEKINGLRHDKIHFPQDHIDGDDIWICTVDGTMFSSWERAGETAVKDPRNFSHKHHSAGFNAEVAISVKESRCLWINGPGRAGEDVDLVLFRKPGGLREKLLAWRKKGIADGGYSGEPLVLSTPNGHDIASVRKFKSRALKRHEKFNSMLKCFKCLSVKFRHTACDPTKNTDAEEEEEMSEAEGKRREEVCFGAVAVLCQYQLENSQPLYNIYVGDM